MINWVKVFKNEIKVQKKVTFEIYLKKKIHNLLFRVSVKFIYKTLVKMDASAGDLIRTKHEQHKPRES